MKAIVCEQYGSPDEVLELKEVDKPKIGDAEVLVRVHATSVNPADWHMVWGDPYVARLALGPRKPKVSIVDCDIAGQVEAVGVDVTAFQSGDDVFGSPFESRSKKATLRARSSSPSDNARRGQSEATALLASHCCQSASSRLAAAAPSTP